MKVLFAVSNSNITDSVVSRYQQKFKEIITSKNVYYFNAIINELQKDKSYDSIVISEDLEPISNNNYDAIDKFILEKLDRISDEASKITGEDIPIIFICSDRRTNNDKLLRSLFSMSIYNALVGNDRSINNVCDLINKPRNKKEAKKYYQIENDNDVVDYVSQNGKEELVSETQMQSILSYYNKIGNNEKKCVEAFDRISTQYDQTQLRLIAKMLPMSVKAILEQKSATYQRLMTGGTVLSNGNDVRYSNNNESNKLDFLEKDLERSKLSAPVVIPASININKNNNRRANNAITNNGLNTNANITNDNNFNQNNNLIGNNNFNTNSNLTEGKNPNPNENSYNQSMLYNNYANNPYSMSNSFNNMGGGYTMTNQIQPNEPINSNLSSNINFENETTANVEKSLQNETSNLGIDEEVKKRGRGRPKKVKPVEENGALKRGRGRPKKIVTEPENNAENNTNIQNIENKQLQQQNEQITNTNSNSIVSQSPYMQANTNNYGTTGSKTNNVYGQTDSTPYEVSSSNTNNPSEQISVNPYDNLESSINNQYDQTNINPYEVSRLNNNGFLDQQNKNDNNDIKQGQNINNSYNQTENNQQNSNTNNLYNPMESSQQNLNTNNLYNPMESNQQNLNTNNLYNPMESNQQNSNTNNLYNPMESSQQNSNTNNFYSSMESGQQNSSTNNFYNQGERTQQNLNSTNNPYDEMNSTKQNPYGSMQQNSYNSYNQNNNFNNRGYQNDPNQRNSVSGYDEFGFYSTELVNNNPQKENNNVNMMPNNTKGKIATFVGTTKNGTSFIINNLAQYMSQGNVKIAILDATRNKNDYYMFTNNDQRLMKIASSSVQSLATGSINGIKINNNLTVFTSIPDSMSAVNSNQVIDTLQENFDISLIDCDFESDPNYFIHANEIYLVQTMDAFTIQPLTKFLSNLKSRNVLDESKLRIIINKYVNLKRLDYRLIIGGMSKYNEPSMTLQRDLFNPNNVKNVIVPFNEQNYEKYLEEIAMCQLSLDGFTQDLLSSLETIKQMVFPQMPNNSTRNDEKKYGNYEKKEKRHGIGLFGKKNKTENNANNNSMPQFTNDMNNTLNRMRNNF